MLEEDNKDYEEIINGDLLELSENDAVARESDDEIIFFQSLGVLCENLAAVEYFYEKAGNKAQSVKFR